MKKYKIIINNNPNSNQIKQLLLNKLNNCNFIYDDNEFSFLFIIGGDGTFLKSIKPFLLDKDKKIIFINSGNLGFLSSIKNVDSFDINEILNDKNFSNIDLIKTNYDGKDYYGINEICIESNYSSKQEIYINNILIDKNVSNGTLICTPFGSSARNKSLGGPILLPNSNSICINQIEPINNINSYSLNSKIIVNNKDIIKVKSIFKNRWWLLVDGEENEFNIKNLDIEFISIKSKCSLFINVDCESWINRIKNSFVK